MCINSQLSIKKFLMGIRALSLGTTMANFCGQNLGAGKHDRIYRGMKEAFFLCFAISAICAFVLLFGGPFFINWFIKEPTEEVIYYAMHYLKIISIFQIPLSWIFCYRNALQGLGKRLLPMLSGFIELFCRQIVVSLFAETYGYTAVCLADPITWIATAFPLMVTYFYWKGRTRKFSIPV